MDLLALISLGLRSCLIGGGSLVCLSSAVCLIFGDGLLICGFLLADLF